jgi:hypothetical protein
MRKQLLRAGLVLGLMLLFPMAANAQYNSNNYKVVESFIGSGGDVDSCSGGQFCARQTLGETAVGAQSSTNFTAQSGFNTTDEELLEVEVDGTLIDLGELTPLDTKFGSTTFSVRNYLSQGYVVRVQGKPPANPSGGHELTPMAVQTTPTAGQEEFGINLRDNATPDVGADPVQVPDSSFSYGTYTSGYGIADSFKYIEDEIVAESLTSSGKTIYTISIIANISTGTPGGTYRGYIYVNAIPTF